MNNMLKQTDKQAKKKIEMQILNKETVSEEY